MFVTACVLKFATRLLLFVLVLLMALLLLFVVETVAVVGLLLMGAITIGFVV